MAQRHERRPGPYRLRERSCDGTGCHYDEFPWMPERPRAGYSAGEEAPGSHCFARSLPPNYFSSTIEEPYLLQCTHCEEIAVSDTDDVHAQPCPSEPRAILRWFAELLAGVTFALVTPPGRCAAKALRRARECRSVRWRWMEMVCGSRRNRLLYLGRCMWLSDAPRSASALIDSAERCTSGVLADSSAARARV